MSAGHDAAASALLALVEEDRRARCDEIGARTEATVTALLREARQQANRLTREALEHERQRLRDGLAALDARLATARRRQAQRRLRAALDLAWERLPAVLAARWADADGRRLWVAAALDAAYEALEPGDWCVAHAPGLPAAEQAAIVARLAEQGVGAPRFEPDAGMGAGLQVRAGANCIDASLDGILRDRAELGARLAAALEGPEVAA